MKLLQSNLSRLYDRLRFFREFAQVAMPVLLLLFGLLFSVSARAQENAILALAASQHDGSVVVRVTLKNPPAKPPIGFSISNPSRIALDFAATSNATGNTLQEIALGDVRSVNIVQAGERSRLIFNLLRNKNYVSTVEGQTVVIRIDDGAGFNEVAAHAPPLATKPSLVTPAQALREVDFRRGSGGEGRVVIDLPPNQAGIDVRGQGQGVVVDFIKTSLPESLRRRLDVTDFGTPVSLITTTTQGENVRMQIEAKGAWEHSAYQNESQLVVEVRPLKEDPNKLGQGTRNYRGEKLSLNFQNVEVRAVLQVIADFTSLNIITSDTVNGNLTLRLKDVPWDQALDIVLQSKGLDMRKNGSVIWIAPKDELLTKEKLELEQRAQIADLEPLRTETFQLNYQKAESFKLIFGLDSGAAAGAAPVADGKNRILSKRGSAVMDPRTNQMFVTDIASRLEEIRKLVQKVDIPSRQVLIEARIVEADDKFSRNLGAKLGFADMRNIRGGDAGYQLSQNSNTRAAVTGNLLGVGEQTGQVKVGDQSYIPNAQFVNLPASGINGLNPGSLAISLFSAAANRFLNLELSALEADGKGKIISSPRVVTADQLKALIEQGTELPYQQATSSGATSIAFRKANLRLEVKPQITPDGNVILEVDVNKDSVGQETRSGFAIDTKHVKTQVLVENGGTVVLGGIFQQVERDEVSKVPFFGDMPVLGYLFKTSGRTSTKTELLIFITPKIVTDRVVGR